MIRLDEVRARIEDEVPELAGMLGNAGQFAQIIESNQLPQQELGGFVIPGPVTGGAPNAAAGLFRQAFQEVVLVVLVVRVAGDALGNVAIDQVTPLVRSVVEAVAGWGPDDAPGVFVLLRAELVGSKDGALVYQIDFALDDQLRITS